MTKKVLHDLDVDYVRSCFPTFAEPLAARTAFFENAGGSYVVGQVIDKLLHFYRVNKVQPYGHAEILNLAGEQMDAGRQAMIDLLGMPADTITLGPSTTQNINTLAHACEAIVDRNSEIIVSEQDHEANIGAWERLCLRSGAKLRLWEVNIETGELDISELQNMLNPKVKIVAMTHSSNILGSLNPVEEVVDLCRHNGSRSIIDGVSFVPHQWPNLSIFQPDAYVFSTYKTYATHLGVMYTARDFAEELEPQCHYFNTEYPHKRFDSAGPDHGSIAALAGLGEYFEQTHFHHFGKKRVSLKKKAGQISAFMHKHESALCAQLLSGLRNLPVRIIGKTTGKWREANVALVSDKHTSDTLSKVLAEKDIAANSGDFYARRLLEKLNLIEGYGGVLRISLAHYNTSDEINRVLNVLEAMH
ncbi:MAG: aminotransferase class V-fold PLP-dependent enzyme [Gammaproteobacteria bacterium]|nr:aminotransferase class V-fold PLP-dependent enzyme [Gammaproteobacteria bacterium]